MDLNFPRFEQDKHGTVLPPDLAVMMVGVAARQAVSPTALLQARQLGSPIAAQLFAPLHGAFNAAMASALLRWKEV